MTTKYMKSCDSSKGFHNPKFENDYHPFSPCSRDQTS